MNVDKRKKILIIEDDPHFQKLLTKLLSSRYDITLICRCKDAIELIKGNRLFDIILCDYFVEDRPILDLLSFCKQISYPAKIILMSATHVDYISSVKNRVWDFFIEKPVNIGELINLIEKL